MFRPLDRPASGRASWWGTSSCRVLFLSLLWPPAKVQRWPDNATLYAHSMLSVSGAWHCIVLWCSYPGHCYESLSCYITLQSFLWNQCLLTCECVGVEHVIAVAMVMEKVKREVCMLWTGSSEGQTWTLGPMDQGSKDGPWIDSTNKQGYVWGWWWRRCWPESR